jgi:hypothetical protein
MSAFDLDTFMDNTTSDAGSTSINPIPAGEYTAIIKDLSKPHEFTSKTGAARYVTDITWELVNVDPKIVEEVGRDTLTVRQSIWLDLNNGALDMGKGKNVSLNQVREAVKQNVAGQAWSPKNLIGAGPALIVVSHRHDKDDPSRIYTEVKKVGRAS